MAQAKTLTPAEIDQLLSHINTRKYAARNRSMMLLTHWAGLRIGEVAGLRSFDRKYYFIRKDFAVAHQPKIMSALEKGDKTAEELARVLGLPPEACLAILLHMAEEGELLEKNKGKFALA